MRRLGPNPALCELRVAIVSDAAPGRNGVGAYYADLLEQLAPRMASVSLFSPRVEAGRWQAGWTLPLPGDRTQKLCFPNPRGLRRELIEAAPHLVIVATPGPYGLTGARLADRLGLPVLAGFHTAFEQLSELYWHNSWRGKVVHGLFERSHRYLFTRARAVLGNSEVMLALARRLGAARTELIGTPLSAEFATSPRPGYGGDLKRVLFAGRLAAEKNLSAVIEAARAHPDLLVSVAGDGPERERMRRAAAELPNLRLLGWLDRAALRAEVDHHDLLLLPSHFESFGTIALEVMARERPVLVSDGCGIAHWPGLSEGLSVIGSAETVAGALDRLRAESPATRRERARQAARLALALNERCLGHWAELMLEVLAPVHPAPTAMNSGAG